MHAPVAFIRRIRVLPTTPGILKIFFIKIVIMCIYSTVNYTCAAHQLSLIIKVCKLFMRFIFVNPLQSANIEKGLTIIKRQKV
jgi:hypothetical protein